jgi:hypothetical protein
MSLLDYKQSGIVARYESRRREYRGSDVYYGRLGTVVILVFHILEARNRPVGFEQWRKPYRHELRRLADRRKLCDNI